MNQVATVTMVTGYYSCVGLYASSTLLALAYLLVLGTSYQVNYGLTRSDYVHFRTCMVKRKRGIQQVPSLQRLAARQVIRNEGVHALHNVRTSTRNRRLFRLQGRMDVEMQGGRDASTQTGKRPRTAAQEGAEQAGQGLQVTVPRNVPHLYNNNFTVKLTYADNYRHEFNYGTTAQQYFRTNSIFDPDVSGSGHQPIMRDLWASQYDYYTVVACDYEIHLYNGATDVLTWTSVGTSSQRTGVAQATLLATTNASDFVTTTTVFPMAEMKNTITKFFVPEDTVTFKGTLTPGDFIVDAKDADSDTTWTAVGSNPAVPRFLGYVLTSAQQGALIGQNETPWIVAWAYVKLDFTVQFTQIAPALREVSS